MAKKIKDTGRLAKEAVALMRDKRCNCSESMITVMAQRFGFDPALSKVGTPFGGGISGNADLCGLLTGGLIVIGQIFGRTAQGDQETKAKCYAVGSEYYQWFMSRFGRCTDLKGDPTVSPYDDCYDAGSVAVPYLVALIEKHLKKAKKR